MRVYRSSNALLLGVLLIIFSYSLLSYAGDRFVKIKKTELVRVQNKLALRAELDFQLSETARAALHSGISLYWNVSLALKQEQWRGLWRKTLLTRAYRYSLSYHTLVNNYRVTDEQTMLFRRFASLDGALSYMGRIEYNDLPVTVHVPEQCIIGVFNVTFDKEALPSPLRPVAYFESSWDLSANERQWCE